MKELDSTILNGAKLLRVKKNSEADILYKGDTIYKVFKDISKLGRIGKERKIEILSSLQLDNFVLPKDKIITRMDKRMFYGYSMNYIKSSKTLSEYSRKLNYDLNKYFYLLSKISITLKKLHNLPENIVLGDLNFYNILVDKNLKYYFIDLDSAKIGCYKNDRVPVLTGNYSTYRREMLKVDSNFDRLSMLLQLLDSIFNKNIYEISKYEYDKKSERIKYLRRIRSLVRELQKCDRKVPYIPYLYEVFGDIQKVNNKKVSKVLRVN